MSSEESGLINQCGFVAGGAGAGLLLAAEAELAEVEPVRARAEVPVLRACVACFRVRFDFAVVVVAVDARDVTCDECLVRCLTGLLVAASAETPTARAARSEQTSTSRLRSMQGPPGDTIPRSLQKFIKDTQGRIRFARRTSFCTCGPMRHDFLLRRALRDAAASDSRHTRHMPS
jgi:hypothetical protein